MTTIVKWIGNRMMSGSSDGLESTGSPNPRSGTTYSRNGSSWIIQWMGAEPTQGCVMVPEQVQHGAGQSAHHRMDGEQARRKQEEFSNLE